MNLADKIRAKVNAQTERERKRKMQCKLNDVEKQAIDDFLTNSIISDVNNFALIDENDFHSFSGTYIKRIAKVNSRIYVNPDFTDAVIEHCKNQGFNVERRHVNFNTYIKVSL